MNAVILLIVSFAILLIGYVAYGSWLAKKWGVDPSRPTPSHTMTDGVDYVPAKAPVLFGHHFSSIAGAGPINGPIMAAIFGWVPVTLWVLIGGIFFGGVHDFGALLASLRHKGMSIGEIIETNIGETAKKLFLIFAYMTLLLVVAAFTSIVADTFSSGRPPVAVEQTQSADNSSQNETVKSGTPYKIENARTATISVSFIIMAILFGLFVYRLNAPLWLATVIGILGIGLVIFLGYKFPILYLGTNTWMIIIGFYILVASVTPVWILLQPRDYLSSFLLYGMIILSILGIFFAHPSLKDVPAFTGFCVKGQYLFPALFITIACGAISGFHSLVSSGTTSKQLDNEKHAQIIGYGGMLVECALAIISLISVGFIWNRYSSGAIKNPTAVFATGISEMFGKIGLNNVGIDVIYSMIILAVSTFALTSLDSATRIARFMFQEFWLDKDETVETVTGYKKILTNKYVATCITVAIGIFLAFSGYEKIWPLFGAANQLLAALSLVAIASWLKRANLEHRMLYIPMEFMFLATMTSLVITCIMKCTALFNGSGDPVANILQIVFSLFFIVLGFIMSAESVKTVVMPDMKKLFKK